MYKGFVMRRPQTESLVEVMFDDTSMKFMDQSRTIWNVCVQLREGLSDDSTIATEEEIQEELTHLAKTVAMHVERIANDYVVDGWKFHDLISNMGDLESC